MAIYLLELSLALFVLGAISGIVSEYKSVMRLSSAFATLASLSLIALIVEAYGHLPIKGEILGTPIMIDGLSLVFLTIIGVVGFADAIYTFNYMDKYEKLGKAWVFALAYNAFLASMVLLVTTSHLVWFVFWWEIMTFSAFVLVIWDEKKDSLWDGAEYYITMHLTSTLPLLTAMAIGYSVVGSFDGMGFSNIAAHIGALSPGLVKLLYASFLLAFMAKGGMVPLHFWIPSAYSSAPSNVSTLLSGVMEKMAVYGLVRITFFILKPNVTFGYTVAMLGVVTLVVGTLYALKQTNAKRLLAYHSVGQMGYIWLGVGVGITLMGNSNPTLAFIGALGLTAGLFHALNHALFKGSLFLSAGAIEYASGTKDLNKLSGLYKLMRWTGIFTLIASLGISGVPLFNGFVSKWMIYEAGYYSKNFWFVLGAVFALLISTVTLASFVKFYNSAFGGEPNELTGKAKEVPASMLVGQGILSLLCLVIGIFPATALAIVALPAGKGVITTGVLGLSFNSIYFSPVLLAIVLGAFFIAFLLLLPAKSKETVKPWDCGSTLFPEERYRLQASDYYRPYEKKIGAFYASGGFFSDLGSEVIKRIIAAYVWVGKYFVRTAEIPWVTVGSVDDLRDGVALHLDDALIMPVVRFVKVVGMLSKVAVVLVLIVVVAILAALIW